MPIYEYECKACGERQEALQKMSDDPLVDCAACNKPELKKLISAAAFRLKGGGWYETDFKSGNKKNVVNNDSGSSSASDSGSSSASSPPSTDSSSKAKSSGGGCGTGGCGHSHH
ncbi:MAG: zinc ribbon domain-containing protein [Ectothiorhodospiraceae bacterium]|nr:zinc ribbon domain-containing protein [Ectothiorhodospiraceae bacterium]